MSHRFAAALAGLLVGTGLVLGQAPPAAPDPAAAPAVAPPAPVPNGAANPSDNLAPPLPAFGPVGPVDGKPPCCAWVSAEYLLWFFKGGSLPDRLLNIGSPLDSPAGAVGKPGTLGLTNEDHFSFPGFSGGRIGAGVWLDPYLDCTLEGSAFLLDTQTHAYRTASNPFGEPLLTIRHLDPNKAENTYIASAPPTGHTPASTGSIGYAAASHLWGAEGNFVSCWYSDSNLRFAALAGVRYLDLGEKLDIDYEKAPLPGSTASFLGTTVTSYQAIATVDSFHTRNQFYGGQLGCRTDYRWNRFTFSLGAHVALGFNHASVSVEGKSDLLQGQGVLKETPGGLFAVRSNIGRTVKYELGVIPQVQPRISYQILKHLSGFVAYDFLYWNQVVRPGSEVEARVDIREVPTSPTYNPRGRPAPFFPRPEFNRTDFWAQGVAFGLEWNY